MKADYTHEYLDYAKEQLAFKKEILSHITKSITPDPDNYKPELAMYKDQLDNKDVIRKIELDIQELEWTISMLERFLR